MIPVVYAPTSCGKSDLVFGAAQALPVEIVSMDSMQIYRKMDIGTAKPTKSEMQAVPHHMIDIVYPDSDYDVHKYVSDAEKVVSDIFSRGKRPVFAGGTGLYLETLMFGIFEGAGKDEGLRNELLHKEKAQPGFLLERLKEVDEVAYRRLHPNDLKRIIRAIEVYEITGKPFSEMGSLRIGNPEYSVIILERDRDELYGRINARTDDMIAKGLIEETHGLLGSGYDETLQSMKAIGYRETIRFLKNGFADFEEYTDTLKKNTRHYAKRQIIWGRRYERMNIETHRVNMTGRSRKDITGEFVVLLEKIYGKKAPVEN